MTETVYKLTDSSNKTHHGMQWAKGIFHTANGDDNYLCNENWIHAYQSPEIAALMSPVHGIRYYSHLWECRAVVGLKEAGMLRCTEVITIKRVRQCRLTFTQRQAFAIMASLEVYHLWEKYDKDSKYKKWTDNWLNGKDRSRAAAKSAVSAALAAADETCDEYRSSAVRNVASDTAKRAKRVASASTSALSAGDSAAAGSSEFAGSAKRAAFAAASAWSAENEIDLQEIAEKAIREFRETQ